MEIQRFGLRLPGALWCKRSKYLQTHTQVILFTTWNGLSPHPQGICMLLEVNILNELINYSEGLHQNPNVLFELRGVHIN